jgi:hypothetical protein
MTMQPHNADILAVISVNAVTFQSISFYKLFFRYAGNPSGPNMRTSWTTTCNADKKFFNQPINYQEMEKTTVMIKTHRIRQQLFCDCGGTFNGAHISHANLEPMYKCTSFDVLHNSIILRHNVIGKMRICFSSNHLIWISHKTEIL